MRTVSTSNFEKHQHRNPIQRSLIKNFYRDLYELIERVDPDSILDVGCGEGITLHNLAARNLGRKLEGVDFLDTAIQIGRKEFPDLALQQGDIYNLSYKRNSFDLVLCNEVMEHLDNPKKALQELKSVSKKHIIVSVPNEPYFMMAQLLRGRHLRRLGNHPEHIQHWTSRGIENFVENNGLKIKASRHPFAWSMLLLEK